MVIVRECRNERLITTKMCFYKEVFSKNMAKILFSDYNSLSFIFMFLGTWKKLNAAKTLSWRSCHGVESLSISRTQDVMHFFPPT